MKVFWNAGEREQIQGLDVLGARGFDQDLEHDWVAGITTISIRARYLTLLPWALSEHYRSLLAQGEEQAVFDEDRFTKVLRRLEFIVLASSKLGIEWGESGDTYGVLGSDLFEKELQELLAEGKRAVPDDHGGATFGTYVRPCASIGLLDSSSNLTTVPPRGKTVADKRHEALLDSTLARVVLHGGTVSVPDILREGHHFSVNGLHSDQAERELLTSSFLQEYEETPTVGLRYQRFRATLEWLFGSIEGSPMSASGVIRSNFAELASSVGGSPTDVEVAWGSYELHRRSHYGLELLLSALTDTLMDLTAATLPQVVDSWTSDGRPAEFLGTFLSGNDFDLRSPMQDLMTRWQADRLLKEPFDRPKIRDLLPSDRAVFGLALLASTQRQTQVLRSDDRVRIGQVLQRAIESLGRTSELSVAAALQDLLQKVVVPAHLSTTLRKMSAGQKCSLRFFPEGATLQATGVSVQAGFSGDRLGNVLRMMGDLGFCESVKGGFKLTPEGRAWLDSREESE